MNWLTWQQHKKQFMVMGIILLIFAAIIIPAQLHLWSIVKDVSTECGKPTATSNCVQQKVSSFNFALFIIVTYICKFSLLAIPFVLGLFWGVPLIANEYNNGTNKLIWTRSISRKKWLSVKLLWILLAAALFAGVFAALSTWWSHLNSTLFLSQMNNLAIYGYDRFTKLSFGTQGFVPAAYAFFSIALGAMFGAWFKQILTAIAVTFGVLLMFEIAVPYLVRPHYESPKTTTVQLDSNNYGIVAPIPDNLGQAWLISGAIQNNAGQVVNFGNPPAKCSNAIENGNNSQSVSCLKSLGYHWVVKYQPAYRYWDFQRIETGLYLALSIIPIGATYWLVLRRDA